MKPSNAKYQVSDRAFWVGFFLIAIVTTSQSAQAQAPTDSRAKNLKTLNGHFPFSVPSSLERWETRAGDLRRRVLVATGLWPMPEKTPLNPVVHGLVQRDGFTVEKVYFESLPGHFVTGLLFRPDASTTQRRPGVLSPHGHGGRTQRFSDAQIADQIKQGAERFKKSGSMPKIARCAQLARMGCVTFIFDMLGYADSIQIPYQTAHRYIEVHRDVERQSSSRDTWGFYSVDADLRLQSIMGLQTWNAIRALDFLESLSDVDPNRLAVTGGSGGGTQTILLGAIDDRVKVAFPNGMVSTSMQGGCYCENCNLLRIDTGNVELAALFAPRPQAMTAADDWTKEMMHDGFPELQQIYALTGKAEDVFCRDLREFKHNYNYVTRATMYQWMNRHLGLGLDVPIIEQDHEALTDEELAVWNADHPKPKESGIAHEQQVCRWFDQQAVRQLPQITIGDTASHRAYREIVGGAWNVIFDQSVPDDVVYRSAGTSEREGIVMERGVVSDSARQAHLPLLSVRKAGTQVTDIVIWSLDIGTFAALTSDGAPDVLVRELIADGTTVLIPDLFHQGGLLATSPDQQPTIADKRPYSAFTFAYNPTAVARRSADLLAIVAHAQSQQADTIRLLGTGNAGLWVAPAAMTAGEMVDDVAIMADHVRFANARKFADVTFVPGAVKYGDLPSLIALRAPHAITVFTSQPMPRVVKAAFDLSGQPANVRWLHPEDSVAAIRRWSSGH